MNETPSSKPVLLVLGDAVAPTGFARVMHALLQRFAEHYEVHQIGQNYRGDPHPYPWSIYPAHLGGDVYGIGRIAELAEKLKPSLVFAVNDAWILNQALEALRPSRGDARVVLYTPIDGGPLDPAYVKAFDVADDVVAYTEFGREVLGSAFAEARAAAGGELRLPALHVIPHGVDTESFFPLDQRPQGAPVLEAAGIADPRLAAKKALLPTLADPESSFVVLNANRNQPRKRIDLTMDAFARFARGKPDNVLLYLHMGLEDAGWNIPRLADYFGIQDRLVVSSTSAMPQSLPDSHLNLVYNACDVGLSTSTGEGWGLVSFEHAAARGAQVMTGHDTAVELWRDAGVLVPPRHVLINPKISTEAKIADPADVASALEELYRDRDRLAQRQEAAYRRAAAPQLRWSAIADRFLSLFERDRDG